MTSRIIIRALALAFPQPWAAQAGDDRSRHGRLPVPFTFKPRLSFREAMVGAAGAFLRILLGSVLIAVWGACSLAIWSLARPLLVRITLLVGVLLAFLAATGLVLLGIGALVRAAWPRRS